MGVPAVQNSFSGHESFPFRYPWLKKGVDAVRQFDAGESSTVPFSVQASPPALGVIPHSPFVTDHPIPFST